MIFISKNNIVIESNKKMMEHKELDLFIEDGEFLDYSITDGRFTSKYNFYSEKTFKDDINNLNVSGVVDVANLKRFSDKYSFALYTTNDNKYFLISDVGIIDVEECRFIDNVRNDEYCWSDFLSESMVVIKNGVINNVNRIHGTSCCSTLVLKTDIQLFKPLKGELLYENNYLSYPHFVKTEDKIMLRINDRITIVPSNSVIYRNDNSFIIKCGMEHYYFNGELIKFEMCDFIRMNPYTISEMTFLFNKGINEHSLVFGDYLYYERYIFYINRDKSNIEFTNKRGSIVSSSTYKYLVVDGEILSKKAIL